MAEENNNGANNDNGGKPPADNNAGGGDNNHNNNGKGNEGGDGKTIPVESYNVIRDKYLALKKKDEDRANADQKAEEERLKEQGKFKELAEAAEAKAKAAEEKYERTSKIASLKVAALEAGTVDADAVASLVDITKVTLSEDGSVNADSVKKVIEDLKTAKAYLFGKAQPKNNIGGDGGNPDGGGNDNTPTFKRSQLKDSTFYKEHEKEILAAAAAGRIEDDITPGR